MPPSGTVRWYGRALEHSLVATQVQILGTSLWVTLAPEPKIRSLWHQYARRHSGSLWHQSQKSGRFGTDTNGSKMLLWVALAPEPKTGSLWHRYKMVARRHSRLLWHQSQKYSGPIPDKINDVPTRWTKNRLWMIDGVCMLTGSPTRQD